jgi:hypothetical protein
MAKRNKQAINDARRWRDWILTQVDPRDEEELAGSSRQLCIRVVDIDLKSTERPTEQLEADAAENQD